MCGEAAGPAKEAERRNEEKQLVQRLRGTSLDLGLRHDGDGRRHVADRPRASGRGDDDLLARSRGLFWPRGAGGQQEQGGKAGAKRSSRPEHGPPGPSAARYRNLSIALLTP